MQLESSATPAETAAQADPAARATRALPGAEERARVTKGGAVDCARLSLDWQKPHESALRLCNCLVKQYLQWKRTAMHWEAVMLSLAIGFSAATPVMLLIPSDNSKLFGAITSAIAAIATGLLAAFGWRENHIRYGYVWHALRLERTRYLMRQGPSYSRQQTPAEAAAILMQQMDQLVESEVSDWRTMMEAWRQPRPPAADDAAASSRIQPPAADTAAAS